MAATDIFVQGSETDPDVLRRDWICAQHGHLRRRLVELAGSQPTADGRRPQQADWVEFCATELRRYLTAVDRDVYDHIPVTAATYPLVSALRAGAAVLGNQIDTITAADPREGERLGLLVAGALLIQLALEEHLLLSGPYAWDQSARLETSAVIDVRKVARGERHPRVHARYSRLTPGDGFVLVTSHDPLPLRREFDAIHAGAFTWDYLQSGPDEWRVRIGRVALDG